MSDSSNGPGWWQASDGKWYPPESSPSNQPAADLPAPSIESELSQQPTIPPAQPAAHGVVQTPVRAPKERKPWWRRWWAIALGVLLLVAVIAAVASPPEDEAGDSADAAGVTIEPADTVGTSVGSVPASSTASPATTDATETTQASEPSAAPEDTAAPATQPPTTTVVVAPLATEPAETVATTPQETLTPSQQNAIRSALSYLEFSGFSRDGLINQLSSEYGELNRPGKVACSYL